MNTENTQELQAVAIADPRKLDNETVGEDGLTDAGRAMLVEIDEVRDAMIKSVAGKSIVVVAAAMLDMIFACIANPSAPLEVRMSITQLLTQQAADASAALTQATEGFNAGEAPRVAAPEIILPC
jgi:hypothetical protein